MCKYICEYSKIVTSSTDGKIKSWNLRDTKLLFNFAAYTPVHSISTTNSPCKDTTSTSNKKPNSEIMYNKGT